MAQPSQAIKVKASLTEPQQRFSNSRAALRAYIAGVGAGKTWVAMFECMRQPAGSLGAVVAPTYRMLSDSTLATFLALTREAGVLRQFHKTEMAAELVNGTRVLFRSADDFDRLRGLNLGWAVMDEGALCDENVFLVLLGRLREAPGKLWICSTPRGRDHWLYRTFVTNANADCEVIRSSSRDNPHLPASYIERLESQYTSLWLRQEVEGEWCDLEGTLFKRQWFSIVEHAPEGLRFSRFWDLAASTKQQADFSASACVAMDKNSGDVFIRDLIKMKAEWPDVRHVLINTALNEQGVEVGVESAVHGLAGFQELQRLPELASTALRSIRIDRDKVSRALPVASRAEAGKLKLVRGNWISDFIDEAASFPNAAHDDQIDAVSGAFAMVANPEIPWSVAGRW